MSSFLYPSHSSTQEKRRENVPFSKCSTSGWEKRNFHSKEKTVRAGGEKESFNVCIGNNRWTSFAGDFARPTAHRPVIHFNETAFIVFCSPSERFFFFTRSLANVWSLQLIYSFFSVDKREANEKKAIEIPTRVCWLIWCREKVSLFAFISLIQQANVRRMEGPFNYCPMLMKHKKLIMLSAGSLLCVSFPPRQLCNILKKGLCRLSNRRIERFQSSREEQQPRNVCHNSYCYIFMCTVEKQFFIRLFLSLITRVF